MIKKRYDIDKIKSISVPIAQKYGVKKLALFGSCEQNAQTQMYDIYFVIDEGRIRGWEFYGFINNLEDDLGVSVDVLTYDSINNSLIADSLKDEVILYEE